MKCCILDFVVSPRSEKKGNLCSTLPMCTCFYFTDGCEHKQCEYYSICESDISGTRCVCPQNCTMTINSANNNGGGVGSSHSAITRVCGSDGQTYANECELQKASCIQKRFIVVNGRGHCDLCANVHCKYGAKCEAGVCECPLSCPTKLEPVCGSNFQTFVNECELQKTACTGIVGIGYPLTLLFYGNCSEGKPVQTSSFGVIAISTTPSSYHRESSIGIGGSSSNGREFGMNKPKLCESIRCDYDALCEIGQDGFPRCTCQFSCNGTNSNTGGPVCASDLKLYPNECEMKREACHRQTELRPRPMELCEEIEVRPCNGEDPVRYPGTDIEINCGNGPTRCPQGSFCHRSPYFSKCCPKCK